ncbi:MAG: tRNA-Thr(GGU) m(6)t(6)A37 methyltransferase TsaA [Bermanella sp.]|jgi:tRNA-Thr(GGU) m(6)t(6)A37 methyltransferase TsaA|uniref:tRNA (N6-threonylcarbamoyladenosine(37)-N6)-methyltransferase TrmO n=1 Tax=Glaciecola sp. 33A TaxID=2057807 RepID=UPI000C32D4AB|nr:tRNA (N6-threonylcarbamoyladenosine(37)-N6)-methyltransferase TrmO [Glaciecola sp. 33A]PKI01555.1 tRNA (N6-threonylcarbamoyladenosine(37)-N6)-methyltransferase TrmO [Glaciecola sp. 33A]
MTYSNNNVGEKSINTFEFRSIGVISTPFKQKFGIPRQSQAISVATGTIQFSPDINPTNACRGLDAFSHLWISFIFHGNRQGIWKDTVRPPRLGGNEKVGVFATRSTFRPNPIGLSVVKNGGLNEHNNLVVEGIDLLDQTPIIDIKPYVHYADSVNHAISGFAEFAPKQKMHVEYSKLASLQLNTLASAYPELQALLNNILEQDPRPAYKSATKDDKIYSVLLHNFDIKWQVRDTINYVLDIEIH